MSNEISTKLEELPRLRTAKLRVLWQELFEKPVHPKLRREMMIPILAYRIQEKAYGGLKPSTRKRLRKTSSRARTAIRKPNFRPLSRSKPAPSYSASGRERRTMSSSSTTDSTIATNGTRACPRSHGRLPGLAGRDRSFFGLKQPRKARSGQ